MYQGVGTLKIKAKHTIQFRGFPPDVYLLQTVLLYCKQYQFRYLFLKERYTIFQSFRISLQNYLFLLCEDSP